VDAGPAGEPLSRRVALVIVDGLSSARSRGLPFLDRLRAAGVDGEAIAPLPTISRPSYVTIATGVPPGSKPATRVTD
jgi:predicted AlkP superfamily pyrophosphatase or phosphodiesterase